jgi:polysaccharide export outer membrane protein
VAGCASGGAGEPPPADQEPPRFTEEYRVGVGDTLSVDVWRNPELSVTVPVRPDGRISMPLLGDIDVGGATPEEVASTIESALADFVRDPRVSVIVNNVGSNEFLTRVRVTGAVRQPVSLQYRPGMTVLDVILEAGGVTEFANANGTRLYRPGAEPLAVRLGAILSRGDLSTNYQLRPGDVLTVPETAF